jgi:hypothetical protein
MAALTITEPRLSLVQPTLGTPRLWMSRGSQGASGKDSRTILTCRYHHQATCVRRSQSIPLRRALRSINHLQAPVTLQGAVPLEGLFIQLQQPTHTINSPWQ